MATPNQIRANRENARKSTGPKSALGKRISSRNATRHGFYAIIRFGRRLVLAYCPYGVLEEEQVRTIIETRWQLRRANLVDTELYQMYSVYEGEPRGVGTAFAQDATQGNAFTKLTRYQNFLLRKLTSAEKELNRHVYRSISSASFCSPASYILNLCRALHGWIGFAMRPNAKRSHMGSS